MWVKGRRHMSETWPLRRSNGTHAEFERNDCSAQKTRAQVPEEEPRRPREGHDCQLGGTLRVHGTKEYVALPEATTAEARGWARNRAIRGRLFPCLVLAHTKEETGLPKLGRSAGAREVFLVEVPPEFKRPSRNPRRRGDLPLFVLSQGSRCHAVYAGASYISLGGRLFFRLALSADRREELPEWLLAGEGLQLSYVPPEGAIERTRCPYPPRSAQWKEGMGVSLRADLVDIPLPWPKRRIPVPGGSDAFELKPPLWHVSRFEKPGEGLSSELEELFGDHVGALKTVLHALLGERWERYLVAKPRERAALLRRARYQAELLPYSKDFYVKHSTIPMDDGETISTEELLEEGDLRRLQRRRRFSPHGC